MSQQLEKIKIFFTFLLLCQIVWGETTPPATINIVQKPYDSYINKMENKELGFVLFDRNITVGKSIEKYSIGVMVNVEPNLEVLYIVPPCLNCFKISKVY
jgi:hypothetical protein